MYVISIHDPAQAHLHGSAHETQEHDPAYDLAQDHQHNSAHKHDHTDTSPAGPTTNPDADQNTLIFETQYIRKSADQPTLQHDPSLNHGDLDLTNHGDVISIHGPSHKGPRTMLKVHTIT